MTPQEARQARAVALIALGLMLALGMISFALHVATAWMKGYYGATVVMTLVGITAAGALAKIWREHFGD